jgi:hypothetical protein
MDHRRELEYKETEMHRLTIIAALVLASLAIGPGVQAQTTHPWDVYQIKLEAKSEYSNPYVEGLPDSGTPLVQAVFTGASGAGRGRRYNLAAFWDGDKNWKVRFAPEAPVRPGTWPLDTSFDTNTMDYPGAVSMGFLARFLKGIEWWRLEPHPELVSEYPARFCSAVPGSRYLVYARYGGTLKLDLRPSRQTD